MIRRAIAVAALAAMVAQPLFAQEPSLADMRTELSGLRSELQSLRTELNAAGAAGFDAAGGDTAIDRMNAMEERLNQLTDKTEQMQNRIRRVVEDGTRRIEDIEFRLCEMDETCDLGALTTPELGSLASGGVQVPEVAPTVPEGKGRRPGKSTAASAAEQSDFDAALEALDHGDFIRAADMFEAVAENHAGGPLTAEALYLRGAALENAGEQKAAATAWLEGFTADPNGTRAAESLLGIARIIEADGDPVAACLYLAEIPARFPGSNATAEAETRMANLDCASAISGGSDETSIPPAINSEAAADLAIQQ